MRRIVWGLVVSAFVLGAGVPAAEAAPGELDPTFDGDGIALSGVQDLDEFDADFAVAVQEILLQVLRHAAQDADGEVALAQRTLALELLQAAVDLLVRLLTDGAGIDEHDVGPLKPLRQLEAAFDEDRLHQLRVVLVHLAAVSLYVDVK